MKGIELKIARIRAGLKQYELANMVGISQNRLSMIELERRQASPELLERIREALGAVSRGEEGRG